MGTSLTGSTVASTYTGLLKTSDSSIITTSLKTLSDGSGTDSALQVSTTAVNTLGNFSIATNKFTVASASGNTAVAGTLAVTGATNLTTLATSGAATIGGALGVTGALTLSSGLTVPGTLAVTGAATVGTTLGVTGATSLSSLSTSGAATIGTTLGVTGAATLASLGVTGAATVGTTLGVTGASTLASLGVTGAATIGTTLGVTGAVTLSSNLTVTGNSIVNGNTTIGSDANDLLTVNANVVTFPSILTIGVDLAADKVLILDASDSNKLKAIGANSFINQFNAPQAIQQRYIARAIVAASTAANGTEVMTLDITPRSTSSKILVSAVINYSFTTGQSKNCVFRVTRNGSPLGTSSGTGVAGIASASYEDGEVESINNVKIEFLDDPLSSSLLTYKVTVYGSNNLYLNYNINGTVQQSTTSAITAQEYFS
jgi:hypothetical protein